MEMVILCPYMNIVAINVVKDLRKWSDSLRLIFFLLVQSAKVRILERKFRLLLLLDQLFPAEVLHPPVAVADRAAVFPEQVNFDASRELTY